MTQQKRKRRKRALEQRLLDIKKYTSHVNELEQKINKKNRKKLGPLLKKVRAKLNNSEKEASILKEKLNIK